MSILKLHRKFVLTPSSNNSPMLVYFTPTKVPTKQKHSNFLKIEKSRIRPTTRSAEGFKRRERKQKYRFYQYSPCTPKYIRYQSVKRKLTFDDNNDNKLSELSKTSNSEHTTIKHNIPFIKISTPNTNEKLTVGYTKFNCWLQIHTPNIKKPGTPNIQELVTNVCSRRKDILGRGRFGTVIKANFKGKVVAVKIMYKYQKNLRTLLFNEQNGIGINHINIVGVDLIAFMSNYQIGVVIMKCYEKAQNLQTLLDNELFHLNIHRILRYCLDICNALQYLHSNGIIHLDVKPKNILTFSDDTCKLCDFGTSIKFDQNLNNIVAKFQGTIQYCAPEIFKGNNPTSASDIYSLGITMWQILHRTTPYGYNKSEDTLIYQIVKNGIRPWIKPSLSTTPTLRAYTHIYTTCWNSNTFRRFTTTHIKEKLYQIERNILY